MTKAKKTYRLEQETLDKLAKLAEAEGITATEALERAVLAYGSVPDASHTQSHTVPDASHTPGDGESKAVEALAAELERLHSQLAAKDRQIETLGDALKSAQDTAKAAQALHAADIPALEGRNEKGGRWRRFVDALRGTPGE